MKPHKTFVITSLALAATFGTATGFWMVLGLANWTPLHGYAYHLLGHAQLQVYGFICLFTMGVAMMVLPGFLRTKLQPNWLAYLCLVLMLLGIGLGAAALQPYGAILQSLSTFTFLMVLRYTRKSAPPKRRKATLLARSHIIFLSTGSLWLMVAPILGLWQTTKSHETVLWGFAGLYIAGIGLRVHPGILGIKGVKEKLLIPSVILWNIGLLLNWTGPQTHFLWPWFVAVGVALFLIALRPFRRSFIPPAGGAWLRLFVRTSYLFLILSVALACLNEAGVLNYQLSGLGSATRHMLGSGFILTMIMGMGLRMIPAFETRRLIWANGPWVTYALILIGTLIRIPAQTINNWPFIALGGGLQFLAVLSFVGLILGTYFFGLDVSYVPNQRDDTELFKDQKTTAVTAG